MAREVEWQVTFTAKNEVGVNHLKWTTKGQFHQRSKRSFYICKLRMQLFCALVLGLYFTGVSLPAQKLGVEC